MQAYLEARLARVKPLACAEATGYRGGKFTGICMTSERILQSRCKGTDASGILPTGVFVRTSRPDSSAHRHVGVTTGRCGFSEVTATCVWRTLHASGVDPYDVLLWNTFPFQAHKPGQPLSNRNLLASDIEEGKPFIVAILRMCPGAIVVAVGNRVDTALASMQVDHIKIRHPSMGGANQFRTGFLKVLDCVKSDSPA